VILFDLIETFSMHSEKEQCIMTENLRRTRSLDLSKEVTDSSKNKTSHHLRRVTSLPGSLDVMPVSQGDQNAQIVSDMVAKYNILNSSPLPDGRVVSPGSGDKLEVSRDEPASSERWVRSSPLERKTTRDIGQGLVDKHYLKELSEQLENTCAEGGDMSPPGPSAQVKQILDGSEPHSERRNTMYQGSGGQSSREGDTPNNTWWPHPTSPGYIRQGNRVAQIIQGSITPTNNNTWWPHPTNPDRIYQENRVAEILRPRPRRGECTFMYRNKEYPVSFTDLYYISAGRTAEERNLRFQVVAESDIKIGTPDLVKRITRYVIFYNVLNVSSVSEEVKAHFRELNELAVNRSGIAYTFRLNDTPFRLNDTHFIMQWNKMYAMQDENIRQYMKNIVEEMKYSIEQPGQSTLRM
jgi:hypothetical protein